MFHRLNANFDPVRTGIVQRRSVPRIRILIVDDHESVRRGISSLLSARAEWSICGEASDGLEAVDQAKKLRPDVILMDVNMPGMDGVQATKIIRQEVPEADVILVSQNDPSVVRRQASEIGARDFIVKDDLSRDLLSTVEKLVGDGNLETKPPGDGTEHDTTPGKGGPYHKG